MKTAISSLLVAVALLVAMPVESYAQEAAADTHGADHDKHARRGHGQRRDGMDRSFRNPERFAERMQKHLDLSDLQRQSISNVLLAAKPEAEALRARSRANRKAMHELDSAAADYASRMETLSAERGRLAAEQASLHGKVRADIDAELTPEQRAKLAESTSRRHERRRGKHGPENQQET